MPTVMILPLDFGMVVDELTSLGGGLRRSQGEGCGLRLGDSCLIGAVCVIRCKGGEYLPLLGGFEMNVMGKMRAAAIAGLGFALGLGGVLSAAPGQEQAASAGGRVPRLEF